MDRQVLSWARRAGVGGLAFLFCIVLTGAPPTAASPAQPAIIGGTVTSIQGAPWQVVVLASNPPLLCGGSILGPTQVLTAAHCVTRPNTTVPRAPGDVTILAGFSDFKAYVPGQPPPAGTQVVGAAALRVHPYYAVAPQLSDDVAVVTLASPLNLSGPNAKAIGLAPSGAGPAPGAPLRATGYGRQIPGGDPDGKLYAAAQSAVGDDGCRDILRGTSPVVLCAGSPTSATCEGDSGSALTTTGSPPSVVGVSSFVRTQCPINTNSGFADVTAPEVRAFIDGSAQPPVAPRQTSESVLTGVRVPVNGSPLRCQPGGWSGSPSLAYTFQTDTASPQVLQSGPADTYAPGAGDLGKQIVCLVSATNPGGTALSRTGTTPPIQRDTVRPVSQITTARCRRRSCTVTVRAQDSNSQGALRVTVTAQKCRRRGGRTRCRGRSYRLSVAQRDARTYRAARRRMPRGRVRFTARVTDAGGNRAPTRYRRARVR
jgi:hypothetical protein